MSFWYQSKDGPPLKRVELKNNEPRGINYMQEPLIPHANFLIAEKKCLEIAENVAEKLQ